METKPEKRIFTYMSDLGPERLTRLAETLDVIQPEEHNWRRLVKYLREFHFEYRDYEIENFAKEIACLNGSPSSALLNDMIERRVPLSVFREILKLMKHLPALEMLGVREKPSITLEPQRIHQKVEGDHLSIEFKAYGIPRPNYQWYKRNENEWRMITERQKRTELLFERLTIHDNGEYRCLAINEKGEEYTKTVTIHVQSNSSTTYLKPKLPSEISVYEHEPLRIDVTLDAPNCVWNYIWYRSPKHAMNARSNTAHQLPNQITPSLYIPTTTINDAGCYYCCIFNSVHQLYSDACLVTVVQLSYSLPSSPPYVTPAVHLAKNDSSSIGLGYPDLSYKRRPPGASNSNISNPPSYRDDWDSQPDLGSRTCSDSSTRPGGNHRTKSPTIFDIDTDLNIQIDCNGDSILKEAPLDVTLHLKHFQAEHDLGATYQWYFIPLDNPGAAPRLKENWKERECTFKVLTKDFYGSYICVQLLSDNTKRVSLRTKVCPPGTDKCRDKVALLIGNQKYREQVFTLHLPESDTRDLAGRLRSLGFRVVTLVNLNSKDMRIAIKHYVKLLNTGVYALFYYGGHGFEKDGENYLMGVESSREYKIEHCIEAKWIREQMASRNARLNMMILDMCRTKVVNTSASSPLPLRMHHPELDNAPHIIAYSCSPSCQAFERPADENSIYMTELLKCIGEPYRVENLLVEVSTRVCEVGKETGVPEFSWMHPFFKTNLTEAFSLHDPIDTDNRYKEDYELIAQRWQEVHKCPPKQVIQSDDGILVLRLHFDAEHSNVLLIGIENMVGSLSRTEIVSLQLEVYHDYPSAVQLYSVTCENLDEFTCQGALLPEVNNPLARYRIPDLQLFQWGMKFVFTVVYQNDGSTIQKHIKFVPNPSPLYAKLIHRQDT
ncbi:hypothetical protein LOD99_12286 [Oopsacas minuta]|uniref:Mucosa-associated lymphoid tissue lymphoma translocation protein 1 n=1 Tax=Oopsacas minuta TaxID=111878 RepID=A0AAV7JF54_9METZ|nr:hypothetical protein LOD99_12286 [Oopsacas minuta]